MNYEKFNYKDFIAKNVPNTIKIFFIWTYIKLYDSVRTHW